MSAVATLLNEKDCIRRGAMIFVVKEGTLAHFITFLKSPKNLTL